VQPQYFYLPVYDPSLVFFGSGGAFGGPMVTFSAGYPMGVWLNHDFDWHHRRIYYHGWSDGHGWMARSRPYIHINSAYMNDRFKNVAVNRGVTTVAVNYGNLTRYNSVHQDVEFGSRRMETEVSHATPSNSVNNKIIQRNGNVNDARIDLYRGRAPEQTPAARPEPNRAAPPAAERAGSEAFGGNRGNFGAKASSQRGQSSRAQAAHSAPAARPSGGGGSHGGGGKH